MKVALNDAAEKPSLDMPSRRVFWQEEVEGNLSRKEKVLEDLRSPPGDEAGGGATHDLRGISLIGENLAGLNFSGCDLSGADLSQADLTGANFSWSHLEGAVLFQTRLDESEFLGAHLAGANMDECSAKRAGFGGANLQGASIRNADLEGATLSKAQLTDANLSAANLRGARIREADLLRTIFRKADLRNTDFEKSSVDQTLFDGADLRSTRLNWITSFDKASWIGTDIRDVDYTGAYMVRRFIMDQNYLYEFRHRDRVTNFFYLVWWATSDCGRSFMRWGLWTALVAFIFAGLFCFAEIDYGDHETILSPIYFSIVTLTTLGYGDVLPASLPAQLLVMFEVGLGYLALGGLLSIFANKMARRSD